MFKLYFFLNTFYSKSIRIKQKNWQKYFFIIDILCHLYWCFLSWILILWTVVETKLLRRANCLSGTSIWNSFYCTRNSLFELICSQGISGNRNLNRRIISKWIHWDGEPSRFRKHLGQKIFLQKQWSKLWEN